MAEDTSRTAELEMLRQEVVKLGVKLDTLHQVYTPRTEFEPWRTLVEKRFDNVEQDGRESRERVVSETSIIHQKIGETERRIIEKLEEKTGELHKDTNTYKVNVLLVLFTSIAVPVFLIIITYMMNHR